MLWEHSAAWMEVETFDAVGAEGWGVRMRIMWAWRGVGDGMGWLTATVQALGLVALGV